MNEDKAARYHRLRRRTALSATVVAAALLLLLIGTGWSATIRNLAGVLAGQYAVLALIVYVVLVAALSEAAQLPLAFFQGVTLERRYGLSRQTASQWWRDRLKADGIGLIFAIGGALIVWHLLRWSPQYWWAAATLCFVALSILLAHVAPVLLFPLFYQFTPLKRAGLADRLMALTERAGTKVLGAFEWRLGDRTRKANAALAGIGRTRRILLSDTLLAEHSDEEIEVILAHEIAHHVYHDIWKTMGVELVVMTVGFYLADLLLTASVGLHGIASKDDIAALPLLVLAGGAASLALMPLANALSRAHERRADAYALDMTGNASAFISAMRRLASQNLAEERPSRLIELLFYSHPSTAARIDSARAWASNRAQPC